MSAEAMNGIVPKIVDEIENNQPKAKIPKWIKSVLGTYSVNGVTYVSIVL